MISRLFHTNEHIALQDGIRDLVNNSPDFLSRNTAQSPRAAADAIENIVGAAFDGLLGEHYVQYSSAFTRRAMADLEFRDRDDLTYAVDVKTHRIGTEFSRPNVTSVNRLAQFYEDDRNFFAVMMIHYIVDGVKATVSHVQFVPVEFLGWDCLRIGALGWGQIQIADANVISVNPGYSRRAWMLQLCDAVLSFYPKEIAKIGERASRFERTRERWRMKGDA